MDFSQFGKASGHVERRIRNITGYLSGGGLGGPDMESAVTEYGKARSELALVGSYAKTPEQRQRYDKALGALKEAAVSIISRGLEAAKNDIGTSEVYMQLMGDASPSAYRANAPKAPRSPFPLMVPNSERDPVTERAKTPYDAIDGTVRRAEGALGYSRRVAEAENNQTMIADIDSLGKNVAELRRKLEAHARGS
ncbi:MAG: hypothetical protein HY516_02250 [Candidatus Aenigmarchaeota archaeon]|nr:hypothetical protein [Candidatus Aenigmarchaeota archaeon]